MHKIFTLITAVALGTALFAQTKAPAPAHFTPRPAGEFVIRMPDGSQKLLSSYRGKVVVMAFMYTTCTHCQHTAGLLAKINTDYAGKPVQILGDTIDTNAQQGLPMFMKITGANFPVGFSSPDQAIKFLHGPQDGWMVPMLAFIDRNGVVQYENIVTDADSDDSAAKFLEDQDANIRKEIDKLLKTPLTASKQAPKS